LVKRLKGRGTETVEEQERRLETARLELDAQSEFDYVVINDEVARCASEVVDLLQA
jgi:guanylate kinase